MSHLVISAPHTFAVDACRTYLVEKVEEQERCIQVIHAKPTMMIASSASLLQRRSAQCLANQTIKKQKIPMLHLPLPQFKHGSADTRALAWQLPCCAQSKHACMRKFAEVCCHACAFRSCTDVRLACPFTSCTIAIPETSCSLCGPIIYSRLVLIITENPHAICASVGRALEMALSARRGRLRSWNYDSDKASCTWSPIRMVCSGW